MNTRCACGSLSRRWLVITFVLVACVVALFAPAPEMAADQQDKQQPAPASKQQSDTSQWTMARGNPQATGATTTRLPDQPQELWRVEIEDAQLEGTPAIVDGVVYLGDLDGKVYAWDLENGQLKWEYETESGFIASPSVRDGLIYIGDFDGKFYCLSSDGKLVWDFDAEVEIGASANFFDDKVLISAQDATIYCLTAKTGELAWKYSIDDQLLGSPTIVDDRAFVAGCDGKLHIVDLKAGNELAAIEVSPSGVTVAARGDRLFFGTGGGELLCIDWSKQKTAWTVENEHGGEYRNSAAVTERAVVVTGPSRAVKAFSPVDGKPLWTFSTQRRVDASPVIAADRVFVGTSGGRLISLDLATGKQRWNFEANGRFPNAPAVAQGRLVIASDRGVLYCFGEKK